LLGAGIDQQIQRGINAYKYWDKDINPPGASLSVLTSMAEYVNSIN
jgi:hypothetical protein